MSDQLLKTSFRFHDVLLGFISRHIRALKTSILVVAHASLLGFLFPELRNDFGEMALNLLIAILFLSPLASVTRMPLLLVVMGFRRELGILTGYLAVVHGLGYLLDPSFFGLAIAPYLPDDILSIDPFIVFGAVGLVLTFPLLLTSSALALRMLGGVRWKQLHRLVYPAFVFIVLHRFVGPGGISDDVWEAGQGALLLLSYSFLKWLAWKKKSFGSIRKILVVIAGRYRAYTAQRPANHSV